MHTAFHQEIARTRYAASARELEHARLLAEARQASPRSGLRETFGALAARFSRRERPAPEPAFGVR